MMDPDTKLLLIIVLILALGGALWYFQDDIFAPAEVPVIEDTAPVAEQQTVPAGPQHPLTAPSTAETQERQLVPLPPLDDSDSYFLLALIDTFGPNVREMLVSEALIDKLVVSVDNLTRTHVPEKIRPLGRLPDAFIVDRLEDDGEFYLSPENFRRYDSLTQVVASADIATVAEVYRRFYPLFQESYVRLGYPDGYFNDRVIEVIDHLLATPEPNERIRLLRPHVLYEFADPDLERRSAGQKLLLRMGAEHTATIKRSLLALRDQLAQTPE